MRRESDRRTSRNQGGGEEEMEIKGGCLCGAVRYNAHVEPEFVGVCHCRDCQKFTGSAFGTLVGLPQSALEIQGELKSYSKLGDSGKPIIRLFFPSAGRPLPKHHPPGQ